MIPRNSRFLAHTSNLCSPASIVVSTDVSTASIVVSTDISTASIVVSTDLSTVSTVVLIVVVV